MSNTGKVLPVSAIFIGKVTAKNSNSISQGHIENAQFNSKIAKDFTALFETEVVNKVDKELNLKHTVA
jgi:hypothetical protein